MIGGGDQPRPQTADYMVEGRFPKWLIGTPWEGAPFTPRDYTARWARYHYNHPFVVSLDEAPAFGASLNNPTLYPNTCPEVGIVGPEIQTWTYGSTPVIEAFAKDRDGSVSKVELYAQNIVTGTSQKIAALTSGTAGLYRFHWSGMPDGFYKVTAVATDSSGNASDSTSMGACWQWKNWAWITKGFHNIAKIGRRPLRRPTSTASPRGRPTAITKASGNRTSRTARTQRRMVGRRSRRVLLDLPSELALGMEGLRRYLRDLGFGRRIDVDAGIQQERVRRRNHLGRRECLHFSGDDRPARPLPRHQAEGRQRGIFRLQTRRDRGAGPLGGGPLRHAGIPRLAQPGTVFARRVRPDRLRHARERGCRRHFHQLCPRLFRRGGRATLRRREMRHRVLAILPAAVRQQREKPLGIRFRKHPLRRPREHPDDLAVAGAGDLREHGDPPGPADGPMAGIRRAGVGSGGQRGESRRRQTTVHPPEERFRRHPLSARRLLEHDESGRGRGQLARRRIVEANNAEFPRPGR